MPPAQDPSDDDGTKAHHNDNPINLWQLGLCVCARACVCVQESEEDNLIALVHSR